MKIDTKSVKDLTQEEYRACYGANYGSGGYMRDTLATARYGPEGGIALMVWDGPHDTPRNLKAWALLTPVSLQGFAQGTRYIRRVSKYTVQFWVKKQYRQQGLGKALMAEVKQHDSKPHVFPHNGPSGEFFSGYKVAATQHEHVWLRRGKPKVA